VQRIELKINLWKNIMKNKEFMNLVFANLFIVIYSNLFLLYSQTPDTTVRTPRNTIVPGCYYWNDTTEEQNAYLDREAIKNYPNAQLLCGSSRTHNCHGFTFSVAEGGEELWIGMYNYYPQEEECFWEDGSYNRVDQEFATKVVYYGDHTGITTDTLDLFISKWCEGPRMKHRRGDSPYSNPVEMFLRRACDVPQEYSSISDAMSACVETQTMYVSPPPVGMNNYTVSSSIAIPYRKTLHIKANTPIVLNNADI
jgi:hypothetical protein